ncbi:MAG: hypothetical protein ABL967_08720 [Bryobacteraceae bacterium]
MKRLALLAVLLAWLVPALPAAEFWESKALKDWTDKDIQKLVTGSPWAKIARGVTDGAGSTAESQSSRPQPGLDRGTSEGLGAGPSMGGDQQSPFESAAKAAAVMPDITVAVRWLTSLPMRQAQIRAKYGKDADTAQAAKQYVETVPSFYTLGVAGVPGLFLSAYGGDRAKEMVQQTAILSIKGKEALHAAAVQLVPNGANMDVLIAFPRMMPITLADQEVTFTTRLGSMSVRTTFRLKDMQVRGKLEL